MDPVTYTVSEFCSAHRISRSLYYALRRQGRGPRTMRVGARELISRESATEWRRDQEQRTPTRSAATEQAGA